MRRLPGLIAALAAAVCVAAAPAATAPPAPRVVARGVAHDALGENSQRKLLVAGRTLVLAYLRPVGGASQVFLARSDDEGRSWRHEQVTRSPYASRLASLALFPDGALHLVWTEYGTVGRVVHRVLRNGRWGPPAVLSPPEAYAGVPAIAPSGGRAHVLWYGIRPGETTRHGSIYEILATRDLGGRWAAPAVISQGFPDSLNPALDAGADGVLHAAWYQLDGRTYQVAYARFEGAWSPPRALTGGTSDKLAVTLAASGRDVHIVWEQEDRVNRVVYLRLGARPVILSGEAGGREPVVAAVGGVVAAAWREGSAIVVRSLGPSGPRRALGPGATPAIALRGRTAYVAWTRPDGPSADLLFAAVPLRQ